MAGPLVLGVVGAAIVLLALLRSVHISERMTRRSDHPQRAALRELATCGRTQRNLMRLAAVGSALQLVALLWQATS